MLIHKYDSRGRMWIWVSTGKPYSAVGYWKLWKEEA